MVSLDRRRVVVAAGWVLAPAVAWRAAVTAFWFDAYAYRRLGSTRPVSGYLISYLLADVDAMCGLLAGGLIGGAALGLVAVTVRRAVVAWTVAVCVEVLLAWIATPAQVEGTSPLGAGILGGLLVAATVCGAAAGLAARRHPSGVSALGFLLAAVVAGTPHRLVSLTGGDVRPGTFTLAVGWALIALDVLLPLVLVAAAVAVAVRTLQPLPAAATVASCLLGFCAVQGLLTGADAPLLMVEGADPDTIRGWQDIAENSLRAARDRLATLFQILDGQSVLIALAFLGVPIGLAIGVRLRRRLTYASQDAAGPRPRRPASPGE